ncbi:UDP-glucose 4-epimerase GalE [Caulobacter sp. S45]|uniref:UDP-glucose 4-epimerase GalE n=1 Tax=Caulobacter sp. S45 TaxID=1641861 RepID=UPI00131D8EE8|nr:UDP-glucose 4-epimerase GalE [Caulobacter sp. S45]
MKTIFVTGGAGYVGSHCSKEFAAQGWNVVVYDNLSRGWRDLARWGELVEGDILDRDALQSALTAAKPDVLAHFAALTYVGESVEDPALYYRNNTLGTFNILESMRAVGVDKMIFSSTAATYGVPHQVPMPEDHPQQPINPYGWSKLMVERMMDDYARAYGLRFASLRYFNAAGASPDGEIGERHEPETHVIPLAAKGALSSDYAFTIFGDDFDTRDGTCVRDYIHVCDLGRAHAAAAKYLMDGGAAEFFNLGTGEGTTVKEIADAIEKVSGKPLPRKIGPRRAGDPAVLVASNAKAKAKLGWEPTQSSVDEIVQSAWNWAQKDAKARG